MAAERKKSEAEFRFTNARITKINSREKVAFVTVLVNTGGQWPDYMDLTVFQPGNWREGDAVNVRGDVRKRKPRDGSRVWETQFVAQHFSAADDKLAPRPRRSGESRAPQNDEGPGRGDDDVAW